ncbi:MAG TPA: hypothetical protein ENI81_12825 [Phycisphaerales bacterium]|nr:hypothetical protein [Phycisphaerales bacterium]
MLHYRDRQRKIHIITMDPVLADDVYERLNEYPGMESVEIVRPGDGKSPITPEDIKQQARDTLTSRVLIMDVRRQTKARLQRPYSDIVRFNRPDFNRYCYSVVLGDGPVSLLTPGKGEEGLYVFLSDLRVDYSPACSSQVHSFTTVMKRYRIWRYVRRVCCSTRYLGACKSTSKDAA